MYRLIPVVDKLFTILSYLIIARVILSWIPHDRYHPIIKIIYDITDPLFAPFQGKLIFSGFDLSPIIILIILDRIVRPLILSFLSYF